MPRKEGEGAMEDISDFKLLAKAEKLLAETPGGKASAEDFAALEEELIRVADNGFEHRFSIESWHLRRFDEDNVLEDSAIDFLSEYAQRYPSEFLKHDHRKLQAPLAHGLMPCIISGQKQAEAMADALFIAPIDTQIASYALACGVMSGNLGFLRFLLDMYEIKERFFECFCMDIYARASDMGIEDVFDDMLKSASYEDIKNLISDWNLLGSYPYAEEEHRINKYEIEYIYELVSKATGALAGRSVSDTVNELIWDCGIHISFSYDFFSADSKAAEAHMVRTWDFMKEHGLKFRELRGLPTIYVSSNKNRSDEAQDKLLLLKEKLFPVLDKKLSITLNQYLERDRRLVLDIISEIGSSRVALDCTSRRNRCSMELRASDIAPIIKKGVKVVLDEDIRNSCFVYELLRSGSKLLEVMLERSCFTDEQLDMITDICIERKFFDALNIIRKNSSGRE